MSTIPARLYVNVIPGVLAAGGNALAMNGLALTRSTRVPIGTVGSFSSPDAVSAYFGALSEEKDKADIYFAGFAGATKQPGAMLFAQCPDGDVSAYLRGGSVAALTLAELQALSGSLTVVMDGYSHAIPSIDFSAAVSFSAAAAALEAAFTNPTQATITGSISGTTLSVTATDAAAIAAGQTVNGTGVTAGTLIVAQLTGSAGGTGTYTVDTSQTALSASMTIDATPIVVTYDSVSGAFVLTSGIAGAISTAAFATGTLAASLKLTSATGAVLSQGTTSTTPSAFMDALTAITTNWATFFTIFDPDVSGNANKLLFSEWADSTNDRFAYVAWDLDTAPAAAAPATSSLGYLLQQANLSGTVPIFAPDSGKAAFVSGTVASIDFDRTNGRISFAYRAQAGLIADVSTEAAAVNLGGNPQVAGDYGNGYNYYGAVGTANDEFQFFQRGTISGPWQWIDSYVNQIWLNNSFQLAVLRFMTQVNSFPYNPSGYALVEAACMDVINAGLNFGAFRAGVPLSEAQVAAVNNAAGSVISDILSTQGWYLQILPASADVRQSRASPPITFWYMDGESIQAITLASVDVQ